MLIFAGVFLGCMLMSYLICGIPSGVLIARLLSHEDVRAKGSGNIGMTNVYRVCGKKAAAFTFACDMGKAVVAMLISSYALNVFFDRYDYEGILYWGQDHFNCSSTDDFFVLLQSCIFLVCVVGHIYSVYLMFQGGKGISVGFGAALVLNPFAALSAIACFLVVVLPTKIVSIGSVLAAVTLPFWMWIWGMPMLALVPVCIVSLLVLFAHRANIKRLIHGEELHMHRSDTSSSKTNNE